MLKITVEVYQGCVQEVYATDENGNPVEIDELYIDDKDVGEIECEHEDAKEIYSNVWHCVDCDQNFTVKEDGVVEYIDSDEGEVKNGSINDL